MYWIIFVYSGHWIAAFYYSTSLFQYIQFSHRFISPIAGRATVDGLVDELLAVQPATTTGTWHKERKKEKNPHALK